MRNFKRVLKIVLFLALVILLNSVLEYLLYPNTYSRVEMYHMEQADIDQLIVGTSHSKCGIDPKVLDQELGTKTFNSSQGGEYPIDSYYLIREADRVHDLKQVIYELDPGYWVTGDGENGQYISYLREFPNSLLKLAYWKDKLFSGDFRSTFFPWYFYRNQLKDIPATLTLKRSDNYKNYSFEPFSSDGQTCEEDGFIRIHRVEGEKVPVDPLNLWETERLNEKSVKWFEKIREYCQEEEIRLVVVTTPIPQETIDLYQDNYREAFDYLENYMAKRGVNYLNFNRMDNVSFSRKLADYSDQEGHMFGDTAESVTRELARRMK